MTKKELPAGIVSSLDALAVAMGYHRRSLCEWSHKPGFPRLPNGTYRIVDVDRWKHGYSFIEDDNPGALLNDMDNRAEHLIRSLKDIQPKLVESLPESERERFSALLDEMIGEAVRDAFEGGDSDYFYSEFYKGEPQ